MKRPSKSKLFGDIEAYFRRLRLKEYFYDKPTSSSNTHSLSQNHSITTAEKSHHNTWIPPAGRNKILDLYIDCFRKRAHAEIVKQKGTFSDNLQHKEKKAIRSIKENPNIVIKPADKGGAVVVLDKNNYIAEAERQLHNNEYYRILPEDPTSTYKQGLVSLIKSLPEDISPRLLKLVPDDPLPAKFYLLPKIHKPNNPGRPIVSNRQTLTENISQHVEAILKPYAQAANSYIQDTTDFLNKICALPPLPSNTLLVTMDVASLYSNISHQNGLLALENRLPNNPDSHSTILLTQFILEHNYFLFSDTFFLQTKGTAMGTSMAPQYANIFMANLEEQFLERVMNKPLIYLRYIDDIFMIWTHGEAELKQFHSKLNSVDPNIKLTLDYSAEQVNFLDTTVIFKDNKLITSLYRKPTHTHSYIHSTSSHPPHTFKSVVYSQALRYHRICSEPGDRNHHIKNLKRGFLSLGYKQDLIDQQISKALAFPRENLLQYQPRSNNDRTPLVLTYHPHLKPITHIAKQLRPILRNDPYLRNVFPTPTLVAYRQPPNLRYLLTSNSLPDPNATHGTFPCNNPRCKLCPHINTTNIIQGPNGKVFNIKGKFNCNSKNIIYAISCDLCPKAIYIGETGNNLRTRLNGHKNDIRHQKDKPVAIHFNLPNHSCTNLKVAVLRRSSSTNKHQREIEEQQIIRKFNCIAEGLNRDFSFMAHYQDY